MDFLLKSFIRLQSLNRKGQTMIEYALIVALIAIAVIVGVTAFRDDLSQFFKDLGTTLSGTPTTPQS